jgi:hypothetical protein
LVPVNIEIYPNDQVQLTHQFYSQNYKLPTEGFTVALRKAKIMNTVCAVLRPDFLLSEAAKGLELPAYIDSSLLDEVVKDYLKVLKAPEVGEDPFMDIIIRLYNANNQTYIQLIVSYENDRNVDAGLNIVDGHVSLQHVPIDIPQIFIDLVFKDEFLAYVKEIEPADFPYSSH